MMSSSIHSLLSPIQANMISPFNWFAPTLAPNFGSPFVGFPYAPSAKSVYDSPYRQVREQAELVLSQGQQALNVPASYPAKQHLVVALNVLNQMLHMKEMSLFSSHVFQDASLYENPLPVGARMLAQNELQAMGIDTAIMSDPNTGLDSAIYQNRAGQYVLAFRGTDDAGLDRAANVTNLLGILSPQYTQADTLTQQLKQAVGAQRMELTGLSLGGSLANYAALQNDVCATTFNPAGMPHRIFNSIPNAEAKANALITNYQVDGDIVTAIQETPFFSSLGGSVLGGIGKVLGGYVDGFVRGAPGKNIKLPAVPPTTPPEAKLVGGLLGQIQQNLADGLEKHGLAYLNRGADSALDQARINAQMALNSLSMPVPYSSFAFPAPV